MTYIIKDKDPEKQKALAQEMISLVHQLDGLDDRMTRADRRYILSLRQFITRPDLMDRICEMKLIWIRDTVKTYTQA